MPIQAKRTIIPDKVRNFGRFGDAIEVPPLTDVIGHLIETGARLKVETKTGAVVEISPDDVVAVRALTAAPVRTSQIRATEHAAALAWPGTEQMWIDGWLLRGAGGHTHARVHRRRSADGHDVWAAVFVALWTSPATPSVFLP